MFIDEATVHLAAGKGGDGCLSFHRARFIPKGGPDGGDGGIGGHVILQADANVGDLSTYRFTHHWKAENGQPGRGAKRYGRNGEPCIMKVPLGTVVYRLPDENFNVRDPENVGLLKQLPAICELTEPGDRIDLLLGGTGGLGNVHFKSSVQQTPRATTPGKPGEEGTFRLVLKTIADVGLVGHPNAGKSSLLDLLTSAHPKIGDYAFTTLHPNVGVLKNEDTYQTLTIADVPGLIEGASENRGLGHRFLRHVERCKLLLFLVDLSPYTPPQGQAPAEGEEDTNLEAGRTPWGDYATLLAELKAYDPELLNRPRLIVGNKIDEPGAAENLAEFKKRLNVGEDILSISVLSEEGTQALVNVLFEKCT